MKQLSSLVPSILIAIIAYWSFTDLMPSDSVTKSSDKTVFSIDNALHHLKVITKKPHHVGTDEHRVVQNYIVNELKKIGLQPEVQIQTAIIKKWAAATTAENIIAKIKGTEPGNALVLLTHYDSSQHSSLGASDAGAGVVVILEGVRAFLAKNKQPKNDIIILITDAEEIGLLGAKSFVKSHKWGKNVGLVLNFEARGSGGPSYMLMETNGKNSKLLSEFIKAKPNYPAASSLMYSVYKMLPNDTDLTVFREDGNINGFNFAFIGDHFDYHSVQDSYERMDRESLLHHADYLTTTLAYFSNSDLTSLNSDKDDVYVNFPFVKLIRYPFSWIIPMLLIASIIFLILVFFGVSLKKLTVKGMLKGLIPFVIALVTLKFLPGYLWELLLVIHPQYQDILHGFTYNGYQYLMAFCMGALWVLFKIYQKITTEKPLDFIIAPIFIWLLINFIVYQKLPGAAFFIIPVFSALLILAIALFMNIKEKSKPILFVIISIPTIYIFAPLIKMFPVGLGLKSLFISTIFIVLVFGLLLPVFKNQKSIRKIVGFLTVLFFGLATYNSGFSVDNRKPNSIVYTQDVDTKTAYFGTYNKTIDTYTQRVFGDNPTKGEIKNGQTNSKYNTRFHFIKKTDFKVFPSTLVTIKKDTIIQSKRHLELLFTPQRKINKLEFTSENEITFHQFKVNDVFMDKDKEYTRKKGTFLIFHLGNSDKEISISFSIDKNVKPSFVMNEISYDLLTNPQFNLTPRAEKMMPMPFVTNDAIISSRKLKL